MINVDTTPLVSCIMLSYKRFDLIYEAIDSVFAQDYPNIEFIICDDGSDNFPEHELTEYVNSHKGSNITKVIIYHSSVNIGTVVNRAVAISLARGKYVIGLANDDLFYDNHVIGKVVSEFIKTGAGVITCRREYIDRKTGTSLAVLPTIRQGKQINEASPREMFNKQVFLSRFIAGTYMTLECTKKYAVLDGKYKYVEDHPMYLRCSRGGEKIYFSDLIAIKYSYGEGISTASGKNRLIDDQIAIYKDEIINYPGDLNIITGLYANFNYQRLLLKKKGNISVREKAKICLENPVGMLAHLCVIFKCRQTNKMLNIPLRALQHKCKKEKNA